jgi:hypothetical protein
MKDTIVNGSLERSVNTRAPNLQQIGRVERAGTLRRLVGEVGQQTS